MIPENMEMARLAAHNYGKTCRFEELVQVGTNEHNGLRYEGVIPWTSDTNEWVQRERRIYGAVITILETTIIRNFVIVGLE